MPLFSKSASPTRPDSRSLKVSSPFGANREITYDEEEAAYIEREWQRFAAGMEGYEAPVNVVDGIQRGMAANYLLEVARERLAMGRFEQAATSCLKAVGIAEWHPFGWLLLAEVYARYGDRSTAARWLKKANEVARSQSEAGPLWKEKERAVKALL